MASDARHQNVPDSLAPIPPLRGQAYKPISSTKSTEVQKKKQTAAQVARWRGWSEVFFGGSYSEMLRTTEEFLNNIIQDGKIGFRWRGYPIGEDGKPILAAAKRNISSLLLQAPTAFGGQGGTAITESDLRIIAPCWYPVHAMGYNFLKSNGECAKAIADRIRGLVKGYVARGFKCDEVIIVTHSMGGILARALIHPDFGNLLADKAVKVLGMYHSVMPTTGAAATYKRMRFGFREGNSPFAEVQARLFGLHGAEATAILANAPGPLELLPSDNYGKEWLRLVDHANRPVINWPRSEENALQCIYLQPKSAWWRLINPDWINPAGVREEFGGGATNVTVRLRAVAKFIEKIKSTFHPDSSYASFCDSLNRPSYGDVVLQISDPLIREENLRHMPPPEMWVLIAENGRGIMTVQAGARIFKLALQEAKGGGDETVPGKRSAKHVKGFQFIHGGRVMIMNIKPVIRIQKCSLPCFIQLSRLQKKRGGKEFVRAVKRLLVVLALFTFASTSITACVKNGPNKEKVVQDPIETKPLFRKIFSDPKLVCFGRYALQVPDEAELLWGNSAFPSKIEWIEGGVVEARERMKNDIEELKWKDKTFELIYDGIGPISNSLQIRYYDNEFAKEEKFVMFRTYVAKEKLTFLLRDATRERETQDFVGKRQMARAESLRIRAESDIPTAPGYCIENGFMVGDFYNDQEMVNAGLYIPSLPDVTFSISSNKDAYGDLKKEEFERMKRVELGLLARIKDAQEIQGDRYPKRTVLREGKRAVQHWQGEESLIRRADGVHDFEWCSIGTPKDVANPAEFTVHMYTKVADNMVGAADKSSLNDEEAIALWDKLLSGLKFRVKVPGAPAGSYYFLPNAKPVAGAQP